MIDEKKLIKEIDDYVADIKNTLAGGINLVDIEVMHADILNFINELAEKGGESDE